MYSRSHALVARDGGLHPSAEVLLSWPAPNHTNPEERGWEAPIVLIIALAITFLVFAARIWARLAVAKSMGLDDVLMSLAMIFVTGLSISTILAIRIYGFQWHAWDQTEFTHVTSRKMSMSVELNYLASTTLIKISILCFYRRITGSLKTAFVYSIWVMIAFCAIYAIIFGFLLVFTCDPVVGTFHLFDLAWRFKNPVTCRDEGAIVVACAIVGTFQDLVICLLPIFLVWNLKMPKRTKIALCGIFAIGLVTCVCGILRTYYATYVYYYTFDITWYAYYGWIWTALEADLGVICASAPALKVFFKRYFSMTNSTSGAYGYGRSTINKSSNLLSRSRGKPSFSGHSAMASRADTSDDPDALPLQGIKVSQGLDVHVEQRDDVSQKSFASTRNLTSSDGKSLNSWVQRSTICAAFKPGSQNDSRSPARDRDIERGAIHDDYGSKRY
ncbi:hypothetical protein HBH70_115880 [Parastagonospora nodorum]|nr:hypothetical protein HBI10_184580 [Parastagonospora nodorum]KAH4014142.1 hypothetical protein HBI13_176680 [Parastagonospora nodorum]KAH4093493.1 hypothetical protein HBH46_175630 [Parastagonospora nodorum]KAH4913601.1 hypothetical protein HBH74_160990 [Parastagonospora nodorum]KAH4926309.1 hypothetical protein HBI79_148420 [Parastagonospora nodorum]